MNSLILMFLPFALAVVIKKTVTPQVAVASQSSPPPAQPIESSNNRTSLGGIPGSYIASASSNNANQTDPSKLIGIPDSGRASFAISPDRQEKIQEQETFQSPVFQGYAYLIQEASPIGTCQVPNSKYQDYFAYVSESIFDSSADSRLCTEKYCIKLVYNGSAVVLKSNGTSPISQFDLQIGLKGFRELSVSEQSVLPVSWQIVLCEKFPLGPSDNLEFDSSIFANPLVRTDIQNLKAATGQPVPVMVENLVPGGLSDVKPADERSAALFTPEIIAEMEKKLGYSISYIQALTYQVQVVAGTQYFIDAIVVDDQGRIHEVRLVIFEPLPVEGKELQLVSAVE